jgi:hypothetical protein
MCCNAVSRSGMNSSNNRAWTRSSASLSLAAVANRLGGLPTGGNDSTSLNAAAIETSRCGDIARVRSRRSTTSLMCRTRAWCAPSPARHRASRIRCSWTRIPAPESRKTSRASHGARPTRRAGDDYRRERAAAAHHTGSVVHGTVVRRQYRPADRYDYFAHLPSVRVPLLLTLGSLEDT